MRFLREELSQLALAFTLIVRAFEYGAQIIVPIMILDFHWDAGLLLRAFQTELQELADTDRLAGSWFLLPLINFFFFFVDFQLGLVVMAEARPWFLSPFTIFQLLKECTELDIIRIEPPRTSLDN
jgi:hypothetical protein